MLIDFMLAMMDDPVMSIEFRRAPNAFIERASLTEEQRDALKSGDLEKLLELAAGGSTTNNQRYHQGLFVSKKNMNSQRNQKEGIIGGRSLRNKDQR